MRNLFKFDLTDTLSFQMNIDNGVQKLISKYGYHKTILFMLHNLTPEKLRDLANKLEEFKNKLKE